MFAEKPSTEVAPTISELEVRVSTVRRLAIALLDSGGTQETADLAVAIDAIGETIELRMSNVASAIARRGLA